MATAGQNFLDAVKEGNWDKANDELTEILDNPDIDIDKRTVLSAIEELYPTVVKDMLYIKSGEQSPKKFRPTVNDDDSDDDLESGDSTYIPQSMTEAQSKARAKAEEQTEEVTELIKILRWKLDEEERLKIKERVANINAQHAAWISAEGEKLKRKADHLGGKSRRKRKNKTTKKTKRRKINKRKSNKKRR